jgi:hypothetical protein
MNYMKKHNKIKTYRKIEVIKNGQKSKYLIKKLHSITYTQNWVEWKIEGDGGIGWNRFHHVPYNSIQFLEIQTMEFNYMPFHFIPFHHLPSIQT